VNVAERAIYLANNPPTEVSFEYHEMMKKTEVMLRKSLDALVNMNV
jgi:hypothetical protein